MIPDLLAGARLAAAARCVVERVGRTAAQRGVVAGSIEGRALAQLREAWVMLSSAERLIGEASPHAPSATASIVHGDGFRRRFDGGRPA